MIFKTIGFILSVFSCFYFFLLFCLFFCHLSFAFKHKINKSNIKLSTHYRVLCLILKISVTTEDLSVNLLISSGINSAPKLSKQVTFFI